MKTSAASKEWIVIRQRLCRGDSLAPGLQVSVDSTVTLRGLRSRLQPGSEVHFLPAFGGG